MAILDSGPYSCLKICNLIFLFSSYPNKVKSRWASDSYGTVKSIHGSLQYNVCADLSRISSVSLTTDDSSRVLELTNIFQFVSLAVIQDLNVLLLFVISLVFVC